MAYKTPNKNQWWAVVDVWGMYLPWAMATTKKQAKKCYEEVTGESWDVLKKSHHITKVEVSEITSFGRVIDDQPR